MHPSDEPDDDFEWHPEMAHDVRLIRDLSRERARSRPPPGIGNVKGHATVNALRELMLDLEPNLHGDIDRLVPQIREQSDQVLRVIEVGGLKACRQLGISVGSLDDAYVKALAAGELKDREISRSQRFSVRTLVGSAVLSAILAFAVGWIAGKM